MVGRAKVWRLSPAMIAALAALFVVVCLTQAESAPSRPHSVYDRMLADYVEDGMLDACKYSTPQLLKARANIPVDAEQYSPEFVAAFDDAIAAHAKGGCLPEQAADQAHRGPSARVGRLSAGRPTGAERARKRPAEASGPISRPATSLAGTAVFRASCDGGTRTRAGDTTIFSCAVLAPESRSFAGRPGRPAGLRASALSRILRSFPLGYGSAPRPPTA